MTTILSIFYIAVGIEIFWTLGIALCCIKEGRPRRALLPFIFCLLGAGLLFALEAIR